MSSTIKHDFLVFIGRFQPIHRGHVHIIREGLKSADQLILVIGSDKKARDIENPFTTAERIAFIRASLTPEERERIQFAPQVDHPYNDDRWISAVQASVAALTWQKPNPKIGIIGYNKDHTSYYLKKFPQWEFQQITPINSQNATDFRRLLFEVHPLYLTIDCAQSPPVTTEKVLWHEYLETDAAVNLMALWRATDTYNALRKEYEVIKAYKDGWKAAPYPPTFMTVDAVVRQSGHLLVVIRKEYPGKGLLALPGGFVAQTETLEEAVMRELYEETKLDVPKPALKGSIAKTQTFDHPRRSTRGRTITQCYDFKLNDNFQLPKVKGSDDAEKAFWLTFDEVVKRRDQWFEDHYAMIENMIGL